MTRHTALVAGTAVATRHWMTDRRVDSAATFVDTAATFPDRSPGDGGLLAAVVRGTAAETDAAGEASPEWAATPREERAHALHAGAAGATERLAEPARGETADNGSLPHAHLRSVMPRVAHHFRFFGGWSATLDRPDATTSTRGSAAPRHRNHASWNPAGPRAPITPVGDPYLPVHYATPHLSKFLGDGPPGKRWVPIGVCRTADAEDHLRPGRAQADGVAATPGRPTTHIVNGPTPLRRDAGVEPTASREVHATSLGGGWRDRGVRPARC
ncbi:aldehyde dehydrogenase family protein [Streptomyces typhae]